MTEHEKCIHSQHGLCYVNQKVRKERRLEMNNVKIVDVDEHNVCPYTAKSIREIDETAKKKYKLIPKIVELNDCKDAQSAPSAFAVFCIVYDGKLLADHPISNRRFMNIMDKILG